MKKTLKHIAVLCAALTAVQVAVVPSSVRQKLIAYADDTSYIITIPSTINFTLDESGGYSAKANVSITENTTGKTIIVNLGNDSFQLKSDAPTIIDPEEAWGYINYTVSKDGTSLETNSEILNVTGKNDNTELLLSIPKDNIVFAGEYTGNLQFTISVLS